MQGLLRLDVCDDASESLSLPQTSQLSTPSSCPSYSLGVILIISKLDSLNVGAAVSDTIGNY